MPPSPNDSLSKNDDSHTRSPWRFLVLVAGIAVILGISFYLVDRVPSDFVPGTTVTIPDGSSTRQAGDLLEQAHVIQSSSLFQFVVKTALSDRPVIAGEFAFATPYDTVHVARQVTGGSFGSTEVRVTIPEGSSSMEIGAIVQKVIPSWDADDFDSEAKQYEGFLFPETYLVFKTVTPDELIALLRAEYAKKVGPLEGQITQSGRTELQIITMASILEKEAKNETDAKVISGILWKRFDAGRPLEVDAPFLYALGKTSSQLTETDLQTDGPYNTYTRRGLPIGPIGNPGLAMIMAALHPTPSPYLFYLYGTGGQIHYATTYAEHLQNKEKYLQ